MDAPRPPSIHASAVLVGARAVLIRGPSGSGKSRLALSLIEAAATGRIPFVRLVGDDRIHVEELHGRLLVRPATSLAGLLEVRGLGIRSMHFEPVAVVGLVADLTDNETDRMPAEADRVVTIARVTLPRCALGPCADALGVLLACLGTMQAGTYPRAAG